MDKQKLIYVGGGILALGAVYYFATRPAPAQDAPVTGMPAIMYGGGGGGGGWQMPDMTAGDIPIPELGTGQEPVEVIPFDLMFDAMVRSENAWALASLPADYNRATIVHEGQNTSIIIDKPAPTYAPAEIRAFIEQQEKAGVPINTASVMSMSATYNVPVETIGAAFGLTPNQTYSWLYENLPGGSSSSGTSATSSLPPGARIMTQEETKAAAYGPLPPGQTSIGGHVPPGGASFYVATSRPSSV